MAVIRAISQVGKVTPTRYAYGGEVIILAHDGGKSEIYMTPGEARKLVADLAALGIHAPAEEAAQ